MQINEHVLVQHRRICETALGRVSINKNAGNQAYTAASGVEMNCPVGSAEALEQLPKDTEL